MAEWSKSRGEKLKVAGSSPGGRLFRVSQSEVGPRRVDRVRLLACPAASARLRARPAANNEQAEQSPTIRRAALPRAPPASPSQRAVSGHADSEANFARRAAGQQACQRPPRWSSCAGVPSRATSSRRAIKRPAGRRDADQRPVRRCRAADSDYAQRKRESAGRQPDGDPLGVVRLTGGPGRRLATSSSRHCSNESSRTPSSNTPALLPTVSPRAAQQTARPRISRRSWQFA